MVGWTLLEAALRAKRFDLALALANERAEKKPTSAVNWQYVERACRGLGRKSDAARAAAKAQTMMYA